MAFVVAQVPETAPVMPRARLPKSGRGGVPGGPRGLLGWQAVSRHGVAGAAAWIPAGRLCGMGVDGVERRCPPGQPEVWLALVLPNTGKGRGEGRGLQEGRNGDH